ncbi:MAG: hypothetical protein Kow0031_00170 [Anaerolineae bacterium]
MTLKIQTHPRSEQLKLALTALGLSGLVAGCNGTNPLVPQANAQEPATATPTFTPSPTSVPPTATSTAAPSATPSPTFTPWPTFTPIPTATPWSRPASWQPNSLPLPVLEPIPVVPTRVAPAGLMPVSYSPPDGVDVFGGTILRWEYFGELAEDEWFDIKIRPYGSNDSAFVDWSKSKEYRLGPWPGWTPGLYTWQIGIVKGTMQGETKHFEADLGQNSQPFVIKWQPAGSGGGGNSSGGGGGSYSGGGGGGGTSGGS